MSTLAARLRVLSCARKQSHRALIREFHSPFIALSASNRLTTPSSTTTPIYEKQDESSSEPRLSSSGTRTYVVSEPDPYNNPFQVPSGAYPTSTPYMNYTPTTTTNPKMLHGSTISSIPHSYTVRTFFQHETVVGGSAAVRGVKAPGEIGSTGRGSH